MKAEDRGDLVKQLWALSRSILPCVQLNQAFFDKILRQLLALKYFHQVFCRAQSCQNRVYKDEKVQVEVFFKLANLFHLRELGQFEVFHPSVDYFVQGYKLGKLVESTFNELKGQPLEADPRFDGGLFVLR